MRFSCPFCKNAITADNSQRGYRTVCPGCKKNILVPTGRFDPGCIVGDFIITSHLGRGAIGDVYKATQISLDREVALKILTPNFMNSKGIKDFLQEARAAATLSHMNLVQSYAVGTDDGSIYMAMTYIRGESLKARLRRDGSLPVDESLHIIQQVAEALYYAWDECHIIHRDVKPDNIMLTEKGIVKLTDLGLAMYQSDWKENMEISGSPSYMSPEQFVGQPLDTRSDIYSLGITLYQMLSGVLPFAAETVTTVAKQHFQDTPKPLNELVPGIPLRVVMLVKKMTEKDMNNRFANMEELLQEIWTIRQKTAPNRSMVPEIHTISIKRLDYEKQHEPKSVSEKRLRKSRNFLRQPIQTVWIKYLLFAFPVVFLILLFSAIAIDSGKTKEDMRIQKKIDGFSLLVLDRTISSEQLDQAATQLLDDLQNELKDRPRFQYAADHIQFLLLKRRHDDLLRKMTEQLAESATNDRREIDALKEQLDAKSKEIDELKKTQNQSAEASKSAEPDSPEQEKK